ncbi:MAG: hypothetical protein JY451_04735 [Erythrobacter sp.]|nr:MAG: hypothetical protein JY451_04735 [Erythrobacter sp.]
MLIAACGEDTAPVESDGEGEAAGEVLEGTISDAMLPIDQTRSQAPLADPEPGEDSDGGSPASSGATQDTGTEASAEPVEPAADEPAETALDE